jgi:hypothetical protein
VTRRYTGRGIWGNNVARSNDESCKRSAAKGILRKDGTRTLTDGFCSAAPSTFASLRPPWMEPRSQSLSLLRAALVLAKRIAKAVIAFGVTVKLTQEISIGIVRHFSFRKNADSPSLCLLGALLCSHCVLLLLASAHSVIDQWRHSAWH